MVSNRTLAQIAGYGAVACLGMATATVLKAQKSFKNLDVYQNLMNILQNHTAAKGLLGEPITDGFINKVNTEDLQYGTNMEYSVSVKGQKDKGTLHFWMFYDKENSTSQYKPILGRIELELKSDNTKRLIIKRE